VRPTYLHLDAHEGTVWVAIVLPPAIQEILAGLQVGEQHDNGVGPHITLVHAGRKDSVDPENLMDAIEAVGRIAALHPALAFRFTGVGKFAPSPQSGAKTPVYLVPSAVGLAELRTDVMRAMKSCGVSPSATFDFVPHVCLGYVDDPNPPLPSVPNITWTTEEISFFVNPERYRMPLSDLPRKDHEVGEESAVFATLFKRGMPDPVAAPDAGRAHYPAQKDGPKPDYETFGGASPMNRRDIVQKRGGKWVLLSHEGKVLGEHGSEEEARSQESAINIAKARAAGHHIAKPTDSDDFQQFLTKQNVGDPDLEEEGIPERRGGKWVIVKNGEVVGEYDPDVEQLHLMNGFANPNLAKSGPEVGSRAAQVGGEPDVQETFGAMPNMVKKDAKRYDIGQLAKPVKMRNGWLKCDAFLTRTGVFPYRNPDGSVRRELRLASEVFHPDALASFSMAPVTDDHPPEFLNSKNTGKYQRGHMGERIEPDGHLVRGTMLLTSDALLKKMERGDARQVSCGYTCDLEDKQGVTDDGERYDCVQRNIRGNHVAIVPVARAGEEAHVRMDSSAWAMVSINEEGGESSSAASEGAHLKTIKIDGKEYVAGSKEAERALGDWRKRIDSVGTQLKSMVEHTDDMGDYAAKLDEVKKLHDTARKLHDAAFIAHTAAKGAHDDAAAAMQQEYEEHKKLLEQQQHKSDSLAKENEELKKKLDAAPAEIADRLKARSTLEAAARLVLGKKEKLDGLSDREVKEKVLAKTDPDLKLKGKNDAYVDARFDVAIEEFQPEEHADSVVTDDEAEDFEPGDPARSDGMDDEWANKPHRDKAEAQAAMEYRNRNLWREPLAPEARDVHR